MNIQSSDTRYRVQGGLLLLVTTGKAADLKDNHICWNVFVRKPAFLLERLLFSLKHLVWQLLVFNSCRSCLSRARACSPSPPGESLLRLQPARAPGSRHHRALGPFGSPREHRWAPRGGTALSPGVACGSSGLSPGAGDTPGARAESSRRGESPPPATSAAAKAVVGHKSSANSNECIGTASRFGVQIWLGVCTTAILTLEAEVVGRAGCGVRRWCRRDTN